MPKYRQIHTKIVESFDVNDMPSDFHRLFWILLFVIADREGRGIDHHSWIKSKMFPLREDISPIDIEEPMAWMAERGMILRYQVAGRGYFAIVNFKEYQTGTEKEAPSVFPAPSENIQSISSATPDLLQTYSEVTPAQVGMAESASASESESAFDSECAEVFKIYHENMGMLTKITSDQLTDDVREYSGTWVKAAIQEAVKNEARSLAYAEAILKRWKRDGFNTDRRKNGGGGAHGPPIKPPRVKNTVSAEEILKELQSAEPNLAR